jgi:hypothetical protein
MIDSDSVKIKKKREKNEFKKRNPATEKLDRAGGI